MVANDLDEKDVREQAATLNFPSSVVEYFQGFLGVPPFGFPEPLRSQVLEGRTIDGRDDMVSFEGRPGKELSDYDFKQAKSMLEEKWGAEIREVSVRSSGLCEPSEYFLMCRFLCAGQKVVISSRKRHRMVLCFVQGGEASVTVVVC